MDDCAEEVCERLAAQELWAMICRAVYTPAEQLVLRLAFVQGLQPRAVQQSHPTLFPRVEDVYRIKRTALERLQRSKELQQSRTQEVRR